MIDHRQSTLFGDRVISSIEFDEQQIIRDVLYLHADGGYIDCDPCFSSGNFYKQGLPQPKYKFDKYPQTADTIEATSDRLPLADSMVDVIMFDPPFVIGGATYNDADDGSCIIAKRFTSFTSFNELKEMYSQSLKEFSRILRSGGIIIFKCQDCVASAKQYFSHVWVMYEALRYGLYPKDLFILLAKARLTDNRKQQHARKFHSYFWVFKKDKCGVDYSEFVSLPR